MIYDNIHMKRLFDKYKVSSPLPENIQDNTLKIKKKNFILILKKLGIFSPVYGLIVYIYLFLKEIGIGLTLVQSAGIFFIASSITAAGITAGSYLFIKNLLVKPAHQEEKLEQRVNVPDEPVKPERKRPFGNTRITDTLFNFMDLKITARTIPWCDRYLKSLQTK